MSIERGARSSFWIVPRPWLSAIVALVEAPVRLTKKVSSGSTVGVADDRHGDRLGGSPWAKVSVPVVAV